jgi:hypothetical protein
MKRFAVLGLTALLVLAGTAQTARAQLVMQMSNGWNFTFAGNVNAFYVEQWANAKAGQAAINGGLVVQNEGTNGNVRTGLLPANVAFDAKGKEGDVLIDVHFGFYPEIQNGGCGSGCVGNTHDQFGAQIDMRQVYLTFSGNWGQILAGREIDLYQRQNILTDATLFGIGATGGNLGGGGTTLGRIGFGYVYPNFNAQITYSTPATSPLQLSIGVFQPDNIGGPASIPGAGGRSYGYTPFPRIESEISYTAKLGQSATDKALLWVNGTWQQAQDAPTGVDTISSSSADTGVAATHKVNAVGIGGGIKLDVSRLSIVGSGYYGKGIGTVTLFNGAGLGAGALDGNPRGSQTRPAYGFIGQVSLKLDPKWTAVASWGESEGTGTHFDQAVSGANLTLLKYNALGVGSLVFQATKSLKWVVEYDYTEAANQSHEKNVANQAATGFMVFF